MDDETIANLPTGTRAGASRPAYVRKQATQPKPLAAGLFGTGSMPSNGGLVLSVGSVVALLLVLLLGMGIVNANASAPASQGSQIATSPDATLTATAAGALASLATTTPWPTATAVPTAIATATAAPRPTATPRTAPPPPPTATPKPSCNYGGAPPNPWCYTFNNTGKLIYNPPSNFCQAQGGPFPCIPSFWQHTNGYVDECQDGTYSHSGGVQGACSYHGGELRPLYAP